MLKFVLLPVVVTLVMSACSSNQPPSKYNAEGDYIGWHCSADKMIPTDWRCEQKTQDHSSADMVMSAADVDSNLSDMVAKESGHKTEILPLEDELKSTTVVEVLNNKGYELQLGAYSSYEDAVAAAKQIVVAGDVKISSLWSRQSQFFVILYGHYKSRDAAQETALLLTQANPKLSYWIRSSASITKAQAR